MNQVPDKTGRKRQVRRPWLKKKRTWVLLALAVLIGGLVYAIQPNPPLPCNGNGEHAQAIVHHEYGLADDVLRLENVEKCMPNEHQVLIKVRAASVNPLDWHYVRGTPYLVRMENGYRKPLTERLGVDVAGVVEAVGSRVTQFKPGDEVFGVARGAFGEYARASEKRIVHKPAGLTFEQAAALPVAASTALQGLRDGGKVKQGQRVLINGSSGGVGTFMVQLAKSFGAHVTAVCSTRNVELVQSLGADHVIDYKKEDFTQGEQRYDVIIDNVGNHTLGNLRRALADEGTLVMIGGGGPDAGDWLGGMKLPLKAMFVQPFVDQELGFFLSEGRQDDLRLLGEMAGQGKLRVVVDRTYSLSEVPDAIRYLESGRARGKVIIAVAPQ
jgi:NADPH:quinone reductase-like Zn-dependent oxidoreductase